MKKLLIYTWLPCLLAMFMSATFVSCSDDDDDDDKTATTTNGGSISKSDIIGKWYREGDGYYETLTFRSDNTLIDFDMETDRDGNVIYSDTDEQTYTFDGKTLIITESDGDSEEYEVKIEGNKLILIEYESDGEVETEIYTKME